MTSLRKKLTLISLLIVMAMTGCSKIDNYDMLECSLYGQIIDIETGDPFQAEIGGDLGVVRLYEQSLDYLTPTAQYLPIIADGVFCSYMMPETSYEIDTYMCPLILVDGAQTVTLSPDYTPTVTLRCIPYLRLILEDIGNNQLRFTITRPGALDPYSDVDGDGDSDLDGVIGSARLCYGSSPRINANMCSTADGTLKTYALSKGTLIEDGVDGDLTYEFVVDTSDFNIYDSDGNISIPIDDGFHYFRVSARLSDADTDEYNHSNIVYAEYDSSL